MAFGASGFWGVGLAVFQSFEVYVLVAYRRGQGQFDRLLQPTGTNGFRVYYYLLKNPTRKIIIPILPLIKEEYFLFFGVLKAISC